MGQNRNKERILAVLFLAALTVLICIFPFMQNVIIFLAGVAGLVMAVALWYVVRPLCNPNQRVGVAILAALPVFLGVLLLVDRFYPYMEIRYLLAAQFGFCGAMVVWFGYLLKRHTSSVWVRVIIGGGGIALAGLLALWCVPATAVALWVTATVLLLRPLVLPLVFRWAENRRKKKEHKIITVRAKDIEVIEADEESDKARNNGQNR